MSAQLLIGVNLEFLEVPQAYATPHRGWRTRVSPKIKGVFVVKKNLLSIFLALLFLFTACSGRMPSAKTTQSITTSYFKKYGRKYPSTYFGIKNVNRVTINSVEEVSYKHALADTLVHLVSGRTVRALVTMENKFPGGWRVTSWEIAGYQ